MSKQEKDILTLNSLVRMRIAPSKIHGVGVIAMRDIPQGSKLNAEIFPQPYMIPVGSLDKLFPDIKEYLLERWPSMINGSAFMYPTERIQAFMNHSDDPNYDAITDVALKEIKTGEEITEDYRKIPNWEKVFTWLVDIDNKKT